jgi:hypothetical protein
VAVRTIEEDLEDEITRDLHDATAPFADLLDGPPGDDDQDSEPIVLCEDEQAMSGIVKSLTVRLLARQFICYVLGKLLSSFLHDCFEGRDVVASLCRVLLRM